MSVESARFNLLDHLEYVRIRLIRACLAYIAAFIIACFLVPRVLPFLIHSEAGLTGLVYLSPVEAFFAQVKLALAIGLVLALPFILYQLWALFEPAMNKSQRKMTLAMLPASYLLFIGGAAFALLYVLPLALKFFLAFGGDGLQQEIAVGNYISFLIGFVLPFGAIFQMPIVILVCSRIGILDPRSLARNRKYVIFGVFVVAAVVTPADAFSQIALAIPLMILFEVSLLLAKWTAPKPSEGDSQDRNEVHH